MGKFPVADNTRLAIEASGSEGSEESIDEVNGTAVERKHGVQLQLIQVMAMNPKGPVKRINVLMDSGSTRTYVSEALANSLKLESSGTERLRVHTFGHSGPVEINSKQVKLMVRSWFPGVFRPEKLISASAVPNVTAKIQVYPIPPNLLPEKELWKDDYLPNKPGLTDVDLLLGNDYFSSVQTNRKVKLAENFFMQETVFGWVPTGQVPFQTNQQDSTHMIFSVERGLVDNVSEKSNATAGPTPPSTDNTFQTEVGAEVEPEDKKETSADPNQWSSVEKTVGPKRSAKNSAISTGKTTTSVETQTQLPTAETSKKGTGESSPRSDPTS